MNYIILDPQQTASVAQSNACVEIRGPDGVVLGFFVPKHGVEPADDIAELLRRKTSNLPCYTTQQVLDHLKSLEAQ